MLKRELVYYFCLGLTIHPASAAVVATAFIVVLATSITYVL